MLMGHHWSRLNGHHHHQLPRPRLNGASLNGRNGHPHPHHRQSATRCLPRRCRHALPGRCRHARPASSSTRHPSVASSTSPNSLCATCWRASTTVTRSPWSARAARRPERRAPSTSCTGSIGRSSQLVVSSPILRPAGASLWKRTAWRSVKWLPLNVRSAAAAAWSWAPASSGNLSLLAVVWGCPGCRRHALDASALGERLPFSPSPSSL